MRTAAHCADDIRKQLGNGLRADPYLTTGKTLIETMIQERDAEIRIAALTEADARIKRLELLLTRVLEWCDTDTPMFEIDADVIREALRDKEETK